MFVSPLDALVTGYRYDELFSAGRPEKFVLTVLRWSAATPGISTLMKPFYEAANQAWGSDVGEGIVQLAETVIEELRFRDKRLDEFEHHIRQFEEFIGEPRGRLLLKQAAGATQRTADHTKIDRIGRTLLNGALQWPKTEGERELAQQTIAEFTRIAEILTDTDVLVLRAIYEAQSPLILRYRELAVDDSTRAMAVESDWIQAVFATWHNVQFSANGTPLGFFNVHSALVRLESQGLIGRATSQTVAAQTPTAVTTTPYGLLELGAMFVERAVRLGHDNSKD